jgi:hypothetical protein
MGKTTGYRILLLILAYGIWTVSAFFFGSASLFWLIVSAAALWLVVPRLPGFVHKTRAKVWIAAGLVVLAGLIPPTHLLTGPLPGPPAIQTILSILIFSMPSAAIAVGALLFYSGLSRWTEWQHARKEADGAQTVQIRDSGWPIALIFIVLALLITRMLYNIYWLMVWDSTVDPLGYFWLGIPLLVALLSGVLLSHVLPEKLRRAALYGVLLPLLIFAVSAAALGYNFRQRTEDRAARISQAIEAYVLQAGRYPQSLEQLVPWVIPALPGPVILYQQDWCYDAGEDYYRLAAVDRAHWSSPELFAHVYAAKGQLPQLPPACERELQAIFQSDPQYYGRK